MWSILLYLAIGMVCGHVLAVWLMEHKHQREDNDD